VKLKSQLEEAKVIEETLEIYLEEKRCLEAQIIAQRCWLWSLIIFLIQRSLLSAVFIPHEVFTP
jgi:hypothetical protein